MRLRLVLADISQRHSNAKIGDFIRQPVGSEQLHVWKALVFDDPAAFNKAAYDLRNAHLFYSQPIVAHAELVPLELPEARIPEGLHDLRKYPPHIVVNAIAMMDRALEASNQSDPANGPAGDPPAAGDTSAAPQAAAVSAGTEKPAPTHETKPASEPSAAQPSEALAKDGQPVATGTLTLAPPAATDKSTPSDKSDSPKAPKKKSTAKKATRKQASPKTKEKAPPPSP